MQKTASGIAEPITKANYEGKWIIYISSLMKELKHDQSVLDSTVSDVNLISDFINQTEDFTIMK